MKGALALLLAVFLAVPVRAVAEEKPASDAWPEQGPIVPVEVKPLPMPSVGRSSEVAPIPAAPAKPMPSAILEPPPVTREQLRAVADASVAYGWSGGFKTLGVVGLASTAASAVYFASAADGVEGADVTRVILPQLLTSALFLTIGAVIDSSARRDLRRAGVGGDAEADGSDRRTEAEKLRDHFRRRR